MRDKTPAFKVDEVYMYKDICSFQVFSILRLSKDLKLSGDRLTEKAFYQDIRSFQVVSVLRLSKDLKLSGDRLTEEAFYCLSGLKETSNFNLSKSRHTISCFCQYVKFQ